MVTTVRLGFDRIAVIALLLLSVAGAADLAAADRTRTTAEVFEHHALMYVAHHKLTLDDTMSDYADDAIMIYTDYGASGIRKGAAEIRAFYQKWNNFTDYPAPTVLHSKILSGESVYIVWTSGEDWGTDTFIIRHGKIVVHTAYSGKVPPR